jgi:hypothetical protein
MRKTHGMQRNKKNKKWHDRTNLKISWNISPLWIMVWFGLIVFNATFNNICDKVCLWLSTGQWFSPGPLVSSNNKTDLHDIAEILLKVALNTIKSNQTIIHRGEIFHEIFRFVLSCHFEVSFIVGGNQRTRRKPLTCRKSQTNFIT